MSNPKRILTALLAACGLAVAQGGAMQEKIRQQMDEISKLMRQSEELLHEITQVDRLVSAQEDIVRKLKELEPPPGQGAVPPEEQAQRAKKKQELEEQQQEVVRKLEGMFEEQKQSGEMTVEKLMELLKNLPRGGGGGGGNQKDRQKQQQDQKKKQNNDQNKERKQRQPRSKDDQREQSLRDRQQPQRPDSKTDPARLKRIEAWIASLPPQELERINRNDFSNIPVRYRRLVKEYTALRAKREAERKEEEDR